MLKAETPETQTSDMPLSGVCAALLVPRNLQHDIDLDAASKLLAFLQRRGVRAFALNGATGEYTRSSSKDVSVLLEHLKGQLQSGDVLVLGVGAPDVNGVQERVDLGKQVGVDGYLIPVPYYFPLGQDDISAFVQGLELSKPAYLYNLPTFTTPIEPGTTLSLCRNTPSIVGVKDSSGSFDTVRLLSTELPSAARIIGNDQALFQALADGLCDGVVSGVAGVLPELIQELYAEARVDASSEASRRLQEALSEYIGWLGRLPVPWGLKVTAQFRGVCDAEYSVPLSLERQQTIELFFTWLAQNSERLLIS